MGKEDQMIEDKEFSHFLECRKCVHIRGEKIIIAALTSLKSSFGFGFG